MNIADYVMNAMAQLNQSQGQPQGNPMFPDFQLLNQIDSQEPMLPVPEQQPMLPMGGPDTSGVQGYVGNMLRNQPPAMPTVPVKQISNHIQQQTGAKPAQPQTLPQQILSNRFNQDGAGPSFSDYATAIQKSAYGTPTGAQEVADANVGNTMKTMTTMATLQRLQNGGGAGGSVFAQKLALINQDPATMNLPDAQKLALAGQNLGTGNYYGNNGVQPMPGGLNTITQNKYAEKQGVLGAEQQSELNKKGLMAGSMLSLINDARTYLPYATGSTAGAGRVGVQKFFGVSNEETQANSQLDAIGGAMVSNVPRMEGPQSDRDTVLYREQAGKIADRTVPVQDRLAALDVIEAIAKRQASYGNFIGDQVLGAQPSQPSQQSGQQSTAMTIEQYNQLPPNSSYVAPDGSMRIKR